MQKCMSKMKKNNNSMFATKAVKRIQSKKIVMVFSNDFADNLSTSFKFNSCKILYLKECTLHFL